MTKNDSQSIALNTNWEHENLARKSSISDLCLAQPKTLTLIGFVPYSTENLDLNSICDYSTQNIDLCRICSLLSTETCRYRGFVSCSTIKNLELQRICAMLNTEHTPISDVYLTQPRTLIYAIFVPTQPRTQTYIGCVPQSVPKPGDIEDLCLTQPRTLTYIRIVSYSTPTLTYIRFVFTNCPFKVYLKR